MTILAIVLFVVAVALVSVARTMKAKKKPIWIPLQLIGSGSGLVSAFLFFKLVS